MNGLKCNHTLLNQDSRYGLVACTQFLDRDNREREEEQLMLKGKGERIDF